MNNVNRVAVHTNKDFSLSTISVVVANLCVDVVPSSDGHSQFAVFVRGAACKIAVYVVDIPVFYN